MKRHWPPALLSRIPVRKQLLPSGSLAPVMSNPEQSSDSDNKAVWTDWNCNALTASCRLFDSACKSHLQTVTQCSTNIHDLWNSRVQINSPYSSCSPVALSRKHAQTSLSFSSFTDVKWFTVSISIYHVSENVLRDRTTSRGSFVQDKTHRGPREPLVEIYTRPRVQVLCLAVGLCSQEMSKTRTASASAPPTPGHCWCSLFPRTVKHQPSSVYLYQVRIKLTNAYRWSWRTWQLPISWVPSCWCMVLGVSASSCFLSCWIVSCSWAGQISSAKMTS